MAAVASLHVSMAAWPKLSPDRLSIWGRCISREKNMPTWRPAKCSGSQKLRGNSPIKWGHKVLPWESMRGRSSSEIFVCLMLNVWRFSAQEFNINIPVAVLKITTISHAQDLRKLARPCKQLCLLCLSDPWNLPDTALHSGFQSSQGALKSTE